MSFMLVGAVAGSTPGKHFDTHLLIAAGLTGTPFPSAPGHLRLDEF